jgi:secondary thiamine-phosphate synthase enzyme
MPVSIPIKTDSRIQMKDITPSVQKEILRADVKDGLCVVYVPHTTAGITINEGADPDVCADILKKLSELVPAHDKYRHSEGNSDSHIKTTLTGSSVTLIIENGKLVLGTWQKIFFCEYDGPRSRKAYVKIIRDDFGR